MGWIVGAGFAVTIGVMTALRFRALRQMWERHRRGELDLDDDWDPFT